MDNLQAKMQMDPKQLMILDLELKNRGKSMIVAYILWYFLGIFGGHRFYMGLKGSAIAQLILSITFIGMIVTFFWWIYDAFKLHTWVKMHNQKIESAIIHELQKQSQGV